MNFQMNNDIKAVLYSKEQIDEVARNLGERITKDFEGKNPLVICVLKGAVLFMADIVRQIDTYCELDFMDVSSYGNNTVSSGEVKIIKDLDVSVKGRNVLIVEDIIDTGRTLASLVELLKGGMRLRLRSARCLISPTVASRRSNRITSDLRFQMSLSWAMDSIFKGIIAIFLTLEF